MALEAGLRRLARIDDGASPATGFDVQASGAVTRFAAHVCGLLWSFAALFTGLTHNDLFRLQSRMGGRPKVAHDLFVAGRAFL